MIDIQTFDQTIGNSTFCTIVKMLIQIQRNVMNL